MRIIDVSLAVSPEMLVWPKDPPVSITRTRELARDGANVSSLSLGTHTGTHVDPPLHFISGGATVDMLPLGALVGPAVVADLRGAGEDIGPSELAAVLPEGCERALLRTRNSEIWRTPRPAFPRSYACLTPEGAAWCTGRGLRLVGTDFLSIERSGAPGHPVHTTLLAAGVVILEGLDLGEVEPGEYTLVCLPLKVAGGDGAPARAILLAE